MMATPEVLFEVRSFLCDENGGGSVSEPTAGDGEAYSKRVIADAEKAFIRLLDPHNSVVRFTGYPHGEDGVHGEGHQRYGYVVVENVTFTAPNGTMRGSWD